MPMGLSEVLRRRRCRRGGRRRLVLRLRGAAVFLARGAFRRLVLVFRRVFLLAFTVVGLLLLDFFFLEFMNPAVTRGGAGFLGLDLRLQRFFPAGFLFLAGFGFDELTKRRDLIRTDIRALLSC